MRSIWAMLALYLVHQRIPLLDRRPVFRGLGLAVLGGLTNRDRADVEHLLLQRAVLAGQRVEPFEVRAGVLAGERIERGFHPRIGDETRIERLLRLVVSLLVHVAGHFVHRPSYLVDHVRDGLDIRQRGLEFEDVFKDLVQLGRGIDEVRPARYGVAHLAICVGRLPRRIVR